MKNSKDYKIRYMNSEDKVWIMDALLNDLEGRYFLNIFGNTEAEIKLKATWEVGLVCLYKEKPVGFIYLKTYNISFLNYIDGLYVIKKYRRRGIGKFLLGAGLDYVKDNWTARGVYVLTIENKPMERLVESMGFSLMGTYKKYVYRNGVARDQSLYLLEYKTDVGI